MKLFVTYRSELLAVSVLDSFSFSFQCPVCGERRRVGPPRHTVHVAASGWLTIGEPVICPTVECGWRVVVTSGTARDLPEELGEMRGAAPVPLPAKVRRSSDWSWDGEMERPSQLVDSRIGARVAGDRGYWPDRRGNSKK